MVQGLMGNQRNNESRPNGNYQPNGNSNVNGNHHNNNYVDYLAEARKQLEAVEEFSDEQAYQTGMLNAMIGIGYELRKINKYNRINS